MLRTSLALLALACCSGPALAQTTWFVDVTGNAPGSGTALDPYTSIDFAVNQPSTLSGDTVLVLPGTYVEHVTVAAKGLSLVSTGGAGSTVIDGGGSGTPLSVFGTDGTKLLVTGFTLSNGVAETPGPNGTYLRGGGMYAEQGLFDLNRCVIEDNMGDEGGGAFFEDCVANLRRVVFRRNTTESGSPPNGGGLYTLNGTVDIAGCIFRDNVAGIDPNRPGRGGGLYAPSTQLSVLSTTFRGNLGETGGGGAWVGTATFDRCRFYANRGQFGGGLSGGVATGCVFGGNGAYSSSGTSDWGGAAASSTLDSCTLTNNSSNGGGSGAYQSVLTGCVVRRGSDGGDENNTALGALYDCVASGSTVRDNLTRTSGSSATTVGAGAVDSSLVDCDLVGNRVETSPSPSAPWQQLGGGGAARSDLTDCRIYGNTAAGSGGGTLDCTLLRCQVYGNTAEWGGGVADGSLDRATIVGNTASVEGDGLFAIQVVQGVDSILWNNGTQEIALNGTANSALELTYSTVKGGWLGFGNISGDPLFFDEAANDYHLQAGSPCIDAGDPTSAPDPDGSPADMGALPFDPSYTGS